MQRIRVDRDGAIRLPSEILRALDLSPGSYIAVSVEGKRLSIEKTRFDPFDQGDSPPDPDAIERILEEEKSRAEEADRTFEKLIENPPEVRPEDRRDLWD